MRVVARCALTMDGGADLPGADTMWPGPHLGGPLRHWPFATKSKIGRFINRLFSQVHLDELQNKGFIKN